MMKRSVYYILVLSALSFLSSCTKSNIDEGDVNTINTDTDELVIYNIEKALNAVTETKGILNNSDFDSNYDPDYIYLHQIGNEQVRVEFPVYTFTCEQGNECYGLRYQIRQEDGKTTIIPFDKNRELIMERETVLQENGQFYFSSLETNEWSLPDEQVEQREGYTFYKRKNDINREIYRSADDFTIEKLKENAKLLIHRACAAFNAAGLFYNSANSLPDSGGGRLYIMTEEDFTKIMDSSPSTWYIKIYIGGPAFTDGYDLGTQTSTGSYPGGYYSSGDSKLFEEGKLDANCYLPFSSRNFGIGDNNYYAFGYYTSQGNQLFTPITDNNEINVYILIKHWTGSGNPDEQWLLNDEGALMTKATVPVPPLNNTFNAVGLLMDINQFKNAWLAEGGDLGTATKSGGVREFTLEDAITIFETDSF